MSQAPPADPRCTCSQEPHLQACRIERERQQLAIALVLAARERMEDRARGFRLFPATSSALRWYFAKLRRWSAPRSVDLSTAGGDRTSGGALDPRRVFAAIAYAIKAAERDAAGRDGAAPVGRWLEEHYRGGRSYWAIAESSSGCRFSEDRVRRAMARAHRVVRERLERAGVVEGDVAGDG